MAAYASVVSVINILEQIHTHPRHSFSFDTEQVKSLREIVDFFVDFLESYSHGGGKEAEDLERQIASAARKAEDVIESHVVDQIHAGSSRNWGRSSCFLDDLQNVIEEMDSVKELAMEVKDRRGYGDLQPAYSRPTNSSRALATEENVMIGFDVELIQLMERLTAQQPNRQIIPIVGMGGIGKTTLASNVYEHLYIVQHFDVRFWATVSQQYSAKEILLELLLGGNESTYESVHELGEQLHKTLWGRRYLVVLDDVWSIDAWDEIQMFFPDNSNGSRIVITSRQSNLAISLCSSNFVMKFLDGNKSWELFCEKAFGEEGCPPDLEAIGKKIVRNCKGLPLSIVVIGGHLRKSSRKKKYWEEFANDINSIIDSREEQCLNILSWSYSYLPVYLKPCFLSLGIIPEDKDIWVITLIRLWVAGGFLKTNAAQSLEEVAESHFRDLVDRNLVIVRQRAYTGEIQSCNVHDLLRELCIRVAEKENFSCVLDSYTRRSVHTEHHLVIHKTRHPSCEPNQEILHAPSSAQLFHSLIWRAAVLASDLRMLRVLEQAGVTNDGEYVWPSLDAQFQQVNLKYIDYRVYSRGTLYLPSSISRLWNLQTLIIRQLLGSSIDIFLPSEIWEMPQLRHVIIQQLCLPDPPPSYRLDQPDCSVLRNLQTLSAVKNFRMSEEVCKRIPNIKELKMQYSDFRGEHEPISYYCPHNIGCFQTLDSLILRFSITKSWRNFALNFTFPSSLRKLKLEGCRLYWEDLTVIGLLPRLETLVLGKNSVVGPEWNSVEGQFCSLRCLRIVSCNDLIRWNTDSSHFPILKTLRLEHMDQLDEIPSDIGEIPTFKLMVSLNCSVPVALSALRILAEQEELGNDGLLLDVTFSKTEEERSFRETMEAGGMASNHVRVNVKMC